MNPFCDAEGVGLIPWSPLARGLLSRPASVESERSVLDVKSKKWFAGQRNGEIIGRVEEMAKKKGVSMSAIATAWVLKKGCAPILGLSSEKRIVESLEGLEVVLSDDELKELEELYEPLKPIDT